MFVEEVRGKPQGKHCRLNRYSILLLANLFIPGNGNQSSSEMNNYIVRGLLVRMEQYSSHSESHTAIHFVNIPLQIHFAYKLLTHTVISLSERQSNLYLSRYLVLVRDTHSHVHEHTLISQVKVMYMKNVLISSPYNTISILHLHCGRHCVCVCVCVRVCACVKVCVYVHKVTHVDTRKGP